MPTWKTWLLILILPLSFAASASDVKLKQGDTPPDYLGRNIQGKKVLVSEQKGKLVVVSFWASWCSPCMKELPILDRIQTHLGSDKVTVVAVNYKENKQQYRAIKRSFKELAVTLTHDKNGTIGKKYGVGGIPHLVIIDKSGHIAYQSIGYSESTPEELVLIINKLLKS